MDRRLFGSDGVRGRMGEAPMTPELVMHLGYATGKVLVGEAARQHRPDRPTVLIGSDTRSSAYMIEAALGAGFSATGVDVMHSGPLPPPAVAYLTRMMHLSAGIVVHASHQAREDNEVHFFSSDGRPLPEAVELAIEAEMAAPIDCVPPPRVGTSRRMPDPSRRYLDFCKSSFPAGRDLQGLRLVVDSGSGTGSQLAPQVFRELGAEVVALDPASDAGRDAQGEILPAALAQAVLRHGAGLGIALDAEGDRLCMADGEGAIYDGDHLLYMIARHLRQRGALAGGVVGSVMSNLGLAHGLSDLGIPFARAVDGDRGLLELLLQRQWRLGGDPSGHIIYLDRQSTGDGIIAALLVLQALRESGASLSKLTDELTLYPQRLVSVRLPPEAAWRDHPAVLRCQIEAEAALAGLGRVLLIPSETGSLLRVMVEAPAPERADELAQRLADTVAAELGGEVVATVPAGPGSAA